MHIQGIGAVYGPQLPCCKSAEEAANSGAIGGSGPACDPNCSGDDSAQRVLERMQAAIDANTQTLNLPQPDSGTWFPGVSNSTVILVAAGLGAILLFGRRR